MVRYMTQHCELHSALRDFLRTVVIITFWPRSLSSALHV